jgi:DNA-binding MarR family transcriptional regulator
MAASPRPRFRVGTAYLLAIAGAAAQRRWVETLSHLDVTPSQFKVVMALSEVGSLGQRQLAELVGIDPRNFVPIIDSLAERDLLSRAVDDRDRRRRVLRLTSKGQRLAADLEAVNSELETTLLSPLTRTEQSSLRRMLTTLVGTPTDN